MPTFKKSLSSFLTSLVNGKSNYFKHSYCFVNRYGRNNKYNKGFLQHKHWLEDKQKE